MELGGAEEARETLEQLEERLRRDVEDMVKVLRADIPVQFRRTIRHVFERSARADAMDDAALKALKEDTSQTGARVASEVGEALGSLDAWLATSQALPESGDGLDEHPAVGPLLAGIEDEMRKLLERHSIPPADLGDRSGYKLPSYFVAGHFMKSLVANFWQALRDYRSLSTSIREADQSETREARRQRWEDA